MLWAGLFTRKDRQRIDTHLLTSFSIMHYVNGSESPIPPKLLAAWDAISRAAPEPPPVSYPRWTGANPIFFPWTNGTF